MQYLYSCDNYVFYMCYMLLAIKRDSIVIVFRVVARNVLKEGADQALGTHSLP